MEYIKKRWSAYILLIITIVALDQISKYIVRTHSAFQKGVDIVPHLISLVYVKNYGAAFNLLSGKRELLVGIPIFAITIGSIWIIKQYSSSRMMLLAATMIISGGLSNLIDRAIFGFVTDMISISFFSPVFNVADASITIGCVLLVIYVVFFHKSYE